MDWIWDYEEVLRNVGKDFQHILQQLLLDTSLMMMVLNHLSGTWEWIQSLIELLLDIEAYGSYH